MGILQVPHRVELLKARPPSPHVSGRGAQSDATRAAHLRSGVAVAGVSRGELVAGSAAHNTSQLRGGLNCDGSMGDEGVAAGEAHGVEERGVAQGADLARGGRGHVSEALHYGVDLALGQHGGVPCPGCRPRRAWRCRPYSSRI
jgi:hypothetical protein